MSAKPRQPGQRIPTGPAGVTAEVVSNATVGAKTKPVPGAPGTTVETVEAGKPVEVPVVLTVEDDNPPGANEEGAELIQRAESAPYPYPGVATEVHAATPRHRAIFTTPAGTPHRVERVGGSGVGGPRVTVMNPGRPDSK